LQQLGSAECWEWGQSRAELMIREQRIQLQQIKESDFSDSLQAVDAAAEGISVVAGTGMSWLYQVWFCAGWSDGLVM